MKNFKYIGLLAVTIGFTACNVNNDLPEIKADVVPEVALTAGSADFSKFVSVGASFTAGYTDGALFKASQENSYPNIMSKKFAMVGGGDFNQPLMNDNVGGLLFGGTMIQAPRLYFNGSGPVRLSAAPTTDVTDHVTGALNNFGIPGLKSFHLGAAGYGNLAGVPLGLANPYYARFASSATSKVIEDVLAAQPTFFTFSEIGGNDVLSYALAGGAGVDQTGNFNPATYGSTDITDPTVFGQVYNGMINLLTAGGAKGAVATVPYITSLPHFTTIPYNPVPMDAATATAVNGGFAPYNGGIQQAFGALVALNVMTQADADAEVAKRTINFAAGQNAVVIIDESLTDLEALNPAFAGLKQYRQATADDLIVLSAASFIGTTVGGNPQWINGITVPLADKWVITPQEQMSLKTATDAYNATIMATASSKGLAIVDFKAILEQASTAGVMFDNYNLTTELVKGGLVGLDGIHLTARGYALMANEFLKAIDTAYGSNFGEATNGLAKAGAYPTNYSPALR